MYFERGRQRERKESDRERERERGQQRDRESMALLGIVLYYLFECSARISLN